jgi:hypothetical protein
MGKRKSKKVKVRGFSPEDSPPPLAESSSVVSQDYQHVETQQIKVLPGGVFKITNPITRAPVPLLPELTYPDMAVDDEHSTSSTDPAWKDILSYGTEQDYFSYLLEIGETQQNIAQDSEKEERAGVSDDNDVMM